MATATSLERTNQVLPLQRVGVLTEIPRLLGEMNIKPEPIFAELGIGADILADIENRLPFPLVSELVVKCAEATGRDDFGLLLGASGRLFHLGVIGKLLSYAPDFGNVLLDFVSNHPRYVRGASVYLVDMDEHGVLIGHRVHYPGLRGSVAFSAGAIAFGYKFLVELCGAEPSSVLFSLPAPEDVSAYKRIFGRAKVIFGAEHCGMVYSRSALKRLIPTADPACYAETRNFVSERWNSLQPDIRDRVMRVLVPLVLSGTASLETAARLLVMHPRALNRALNARGMSFRDAVNEARYEMASQLLRDAGLSIAKLAHILGYSEVSAFTRFFTSMAGMPPSEWKAREIATTEI